MLLAFWIRFRCNILGIFWETKIFYDLPCLFCCNAEFFYHFIASIVSTTPKLSNKEIEVAIEGNFKDLFSISSANGDISSLITKQTELLDNNGANTTFIASYLTSLASLMSNLVPNPSEDQKAQIKQRTVESLNFVELVIKSQPGLENFDTDVNLITDPANYEFYQILQDLHNTGQAINNDPANAKVFFDDPTAAAWGRLSVLTMDFSKRTQELTSEFDFL